ncbi:hypothetical protein NXY55_27565 [Aeromonas veronii]|nr:hypothetical protein [Aeromonas veronii]
MGFTCSKTMVDDVEKIFLTSLSYKEGVPFGKVISMNGLSASTFLEAKRDIKAKDSFARKR